MFFHVSTSSTFWRIKILPSDSTRLALLEALTKESRVSADVDNIKSKASYLPLVILCRTFSQTCKLGALCTESG